MLLTGLEFSARRVRRVRGHSPPCGHGSTSSVSSWSGSPPRSVAGHPDVLLGIHPPTTLRNWPYLAVCAVTALVVFVFHPQVRAAEARRAAGGRARARRLRHRGDDHRAERGRDVYAACLIG